MFKYDEPLSMSRNALFLASDQKRFVLFILLGYREFPAGNGPFERSLCQSAGFLVRHTMRMSPQNPLISLSLPKIADFRSGNL
jgi:hypothetical protein